MTAYTESSLPTSPSGSRPLAVTEHLSITYQVDIVRSAPARLALALARISMGFVFMWAFLDKTFGLGFATPAERAWINGGAPAQGWLLSIEGPTAPFFNALASPVVDVLFMFGLFAIGLALLTGAGMKLAGFFGAILLLMMYLAALPSANGGTNPLIDSHIIQALLVAVLALTYSGDTLGAGRWWAGVVGTHRWLR